MPFNSNKKVSQRIIEYIQNQILNGHLKPGDKLPSERQLCQHFDVSRTSVREALSALEIIGLTVKRHGQGNFVASNTTGNYLKSLAISFKLDNGKDSDIMELRAVLEPFAAGVAASRCNDAHIPRLYELHKAMIDAETLADKTRFDRELHMEIARMSGNKLLLNLFSNVAYLFDLYTRNTIAISMDMSSLEDIYDEHAAIIEAIVTHDRKTAEKSMSYHISNVEEL